MVVIKKKSRSNSINKSQEDEDSNTKGKKNYSDNLARKSLENDPIADLLDLEPDQGE